MKSTNKNILLVDDEEIFQELLCEEIPRQTPITLNEISTASSGFEAIQLLKIGTHLI